MQTSRSRRRPKRTSPASQAGPASGGDARVQADRDSSAPGAEAPGAHGAAQDQDELRLPRPPGIIRRFWARHPLFTDILIALVCLPFALTPATVAYQNDTEITGATYGFGLTQQGALPVLVIAACVLLVWRRRFPVLVFIVSVVVAISSLTTSVAVGSPLLLVTSYTLAVYRSSRACWIGCGTGMGALTIIAIIAASGGAATPQVSSNAVVGSVVMTLLGALVGVNIGNRKRYMSAVIDRSRQLLVERDQQGQIAAAAERNRIAREMHDIVSHSLTVVVALSEGAAATPDRGRAQDASLAAAETARSALTEMRAMLGVLRDGDPDAPLAPSSPTAPHDTVASAQRAGYPATLTTRGEEQVAPATAFAIGRIVQEGMTNAMRHAPAATTIAVRIDYEADPVVVEIVNDGASATPSSGGFGIRGLGERAAHVGGSLVAGPVTAGRWMLRAELPHLAVSPRDDAADEGITASGKDHE